MSQGRIKVKSEARVPLGGQLGDLRRVLDAGAVPDNATVDVHVVHADRPGESTLKELVFRWEKDV